MPVRATVSDFGPQLLAKVLGANQTQEQSLGLVFHYADEKGLPLVDLADLRALLTFLDSDDGKAELKGIGGLSGATVGVLLRALIGLEEGGGTELFGEPQFAIADLLRVADDGRGVISCLELPGVQDKPKLFSTALMWLLAELFEELPEAGDLEKPKLVFFFDEAHLLFDDATEAFLDSVAQTVRLIRSKGVGVFFVTQNPQDLPAEVLGQLGSRVQHALRAFTPDDAKALRATVSTYPKSDFYDLEELLTQMGIGEAAVTVLSDRGIPTPVVHTRLAAPAASMGPAPDVEGVAKASPLWARYGERLDERSAREILAERLEAPKPLPPTEMEHVPVPKPAPKAPKRRAPPAATSATSSTRARASSCRRRSSAACSGCCASGCEAGPAVHRAPRGAAGGDARVRGGRAAAARARVGGGAVVPERGVRRARRARLARAEVRARRRLGRRRGAVRGARASGPAGWRPGSARTSGSRRRRWPRSAPRPRSRAGSRPRSAARRSPRWPSPSRTPAPTSRPSARAPRRSTAAGSSTARRRSSPTACARTSTSPRCGRGRARARVAVVPRHRGRRRHDRRPLEKLGWHASDTAEIAFEDVAVPDDALLGEEGRGFYLIMANFQWERLRMSLGAVGAMRATFEAVVAILGERGAAVGAPRGRRARGVGEAGAR